MAKSIHDIHVRRKNVKQIRESAVEYESKVTALVCNNEMNEEQKKQAIEQLQKPACTNFEKLDNLEKSLDKLEDEQLHGFQPQLPMDTIIQNNLDIFEPEKAEQIKRDMLKRLQEAEHEQALELRRREAREQSARELLERKQLFVK